MILSRYLLQFCFNVIEYKVLKSTIFKLFASDNHHKVDHISKFEKKVFFKDFFKISLTDLFLCN